MDLEVKIFGVNFLFDTTISCLSLKNGIDILINGKFYKSCSIMTLFKTIQQYFSKKYTESEIFDEINKVFCVPSQSIANQDPVKGFLFQIGYYH